MEFLAKDSVGDNVGTDNMTAIIIYFRENIKENGGLWYDIKLPGEAADKGEENNTQAEDFIEKIIDSGEV